MDEKVVLRFNDGTVMKGYVEDFSQTQSEIIFKDVVSNSLMRVSVAALKAIFFVRTFEGNPDYDELKRYGISERRGRRIFLRFNDGESLVGYVEDNDLPWERGFFLSKIKDNKTGFFVIPVDPGSNNIKVYVVLKSVKDITLI